MLCQLSAAAATMLGSPATAGDWDAGPDAFWEVLGALHCVLQAWEAQRLVCLACMVGLLGFGGYIVYYLSLRVWVGCAVSG